MNKKLIYLLLILGLILFTRPLSFAQNAPASQQASGQVRTQQLEQEDQYLRKQVEQKKKAPQIEENLPKPAPVSTSEQKVFIKEIRVDQTALIPAEEINRIIAPYQNRELTLGDMQKIADLITDDYRQKGYITSRAYLPPQKIESGILEIRILEGLMGNVEVKGNRFFSTKLIKSKITIKKGEPFNYNQLRKDLTKINENPDRNARTILMPGKEPGQTDLVLEIKDRLPIHVGLDYDNYGSRYIDHNRYTVRFIDNNVFGFDDNLTFQYQMAEASRYYLKSLRYLYPLTQSTGVGFFAAFSRVKLGKEFKDEDVRGKSQLYGLFVNQMLIDTERLDLTLNLGFDYKNITNYQLGTVTSADRERVARAGLDMDISDNYGRTVVTDEIDVGIPNIMGGLKTHDDKASTSGAGGKFTKNTLNLLRLQRMPFSSTLLWKSQVQTTPYILTAVEQFQIGGIANVRGYPPAEAVGDNGYSTTFEWTFPAYGLSKSIRVPFSHGKLYDAVRFALFYDWANARLRRPTGTQEKNKTLSSAGCGFRFNLPEDFSVRVDMAWPLDNMPSDGDRLHTWVQVSKTF
jgi:hemolysin activation/secretion protein